VRIDAQISPRGLLVPVIRNADYLAPDELATRARDSGSRPAVGARHGSV
jgi:hypothetical protein